MRIDADTLIAVALAERPMVHARVKRYVGPEYADDVTQNTYERAVTLIRAGRLVIEEGADVRNAVRAWLTAVAFRMVVNFLRTSDERPLRAEPLDVAMFPARDPLPQIEAREAVRQALYRLNRREREILDQVAIGHEIHEIAEALGISHGTTASALRNVRRYLRQRRDRQK